MRKLQDSILSLLIHMVILFNIERLDFSSQNVIDLDTPVYVLSVLAVIIILTIKPIASTRQPLLLALGAGTFFIVKFFSHRPLVGGIYTYLSFTELGLFLVAVFLAQILAINLRDVEQNVKVFSYANIRKLKPVQEAYKEIEAEIYRSRRFRRPLSVVVLEQDSKELQANIDKLSNNAGQAILEQYFTVILAKRLATQLRETDLLLENEKTGKLVILSPDTGIEEAQTLIGRLNSITKELEFSINFGSATFPDHALAFEQLLAHAESNLKDRINQRIQVDVLKEA